MVKWGVIALALLLVAFGVIYTLGQRVDTGPSMTERQVTQAEDAVRAAPRSIEARLQLAQVYRANNRNDDAIAQYGEILKADKKNSLALLGRGETYLAAGNLAAASTDLSAMIKGQQRDEFARVDKRVGEAHYFLGSVKQRQGDLKGAAAEARSALAISSTDSDSLFLLGSVLLAQGQAAQAIPAFNQALLFVPVGWCEPYQGLQDAYTKLGRTARASYAGAMVSFCQGKHDAASTALQALTTGETAADAMAGLGMIAETANDSVKATSWYQKATKADPKNVAALAGLSRLSAAAPSSPAHTASK
jgi:tetratricopeptide (TPR) repeat protein